MAGIGKGYAAEDNDHAHEGYQAGFDKLAPWITVLLMLDGHAGRRCGRAFFHDVITFYVGNLV